MVVVGVLVGAFLATKEHESNGRLGVGVPQIAGQLEQGRDSAAVVVGAGCRVLGVHVGAQQNNPRRDPLLLGDEVVRELALGKLHVLDDDLVAGGAELGGDVVEGGVLGDRALNARTVGAERLDVCRRVVYREGQSGRRRCGRRRREHDRGDEREGERECANARTSRRAIAVVVRSIRRPFVQGCLIGSSKPYTAS